MLSFLLLLSLASIVRANTEKTIFVAPSFIPHSNVHPGLDSLCLDVLSPNNSTLHVQLPVAFPTKAAPRGLQSWYLLDRLQPGQRYELRVCWVATVSPHLLRTHLDTALGDQEISHVFLRPQFGCLICSLYCQQPTEFWLDTFTLTQTFETPDLIQSLAQHAEGRDTASCQPRPPTGPYASTEQSSVLFLRINSAADFYAKDLELMNNPPLVGVDISKCPLFSVWP